ncbi:hypothetical protein L0F63_002047 [Massospora cicadina]|nr:hypothetical protein L0F63_002047 [Massospora cicadina]
MSASGTAFRVTHDLIVRFLFNNGYGSTLETFYAEGGDFISVNRSELGQEGGEEGKPLVEIVTDYYLREVSALGGSERKDELTFVEWPKFEVERMECLETYDTLHSGSILCVRAYEIPSLFGQARVMITSSTDNSIKISSVETGRFLMAPEYPHHGGSVLSFDVHPLHPHLLLSSSMDFSVALTDLETNERLSLWDHHKKFVVHAKFAPDGSSFFSASYDHTLVVYKLSGPHNFVPIRTFEFDGNVEAACYTFDSEWIIVGVRDDNYLHYIDVNSLTVNKFNMNANGDDVVSFTVMDLALAPSGKHVLAATDHRSGRVLLLKLFSGEISRNYYGVPQDEFSTPKLSWHPSGRVFFVTGDDYKIHIFDASTSSKLGSLSGHEGVVRTLHFDPASNLLLSGSFDRSVRRWGSTSKP